jgi:hypothetical protein
VWARDLCQRKGSPPTITALPDATYLERVTDELAAKGISWPIEKYVPEHAKVGSSSGGGDDDDDE